MVNGISINLFFSGKEIRRLVIGPGAEGGSDVDGSDAGMFVVGPAFIRPGNRF